MSTQPQVLQNQTSGTPIPTCATCTHLSTDGKNLCRRFPPVLSKSQHGSIFPTVKLDWSCGEYTKA